MQRRHLPERHDTGTRRPGRLPDQNRFQNGDLDFDGLDYVPFSWPDGTRNHPTAFQYVGPFQANGKPYPQIQFESNVGGSSALCNVATGAGCTQPPQRRPASCRRPGITAGQLNGRQVKFR